MSFFLLVSLSPCQKKKVGWDCYCFSFSVCSSDSIAAWNTTTNRRGARLSHWCTPIRQLIVTVLFLFLNLGLNDSYVFFIVVTILGGDPYFCKQRNMSLWLTVSKSLTRLTKTTKDLRTCSFRRWARFLEGRQGWYILCFGDSRIGLPDHHRGCVDSFGLR